MPLPPVTTFYDALSDQVVLNQICDAGKLVCEIAPGENLLYAIDAIV
jgi:hypothetical protein